jgi:ubiquinone/menaquinone biosynthesis C-methylase UbiE
MKRDYFNQLAEEWDSLPVLPDAAQRVEAFLRAVVPAGCRRVLDVGCGTGILAGCLVANWPSITLLVELDLAEQMLRRGRAKRQDGRTCYVCADALAPPFRGNSFDLAICYNAVPHFESARLGLRALLGCLRPGGWLAVGHMMDSAAVTALHASIGGPVARDTLPPADVLSAELRSLGGRTLRSEEDAGHYLVLAERF